MYLCNHAEIIYTVREHKACPIARGKQNLLQATTK